MELASAFRHVGAGAGFACMQLVYTFFGHLDEGAEGAAAGAALFAEGGVWTKRGLAIVGIDAIQASMQSRPPTVNTRHLVTNIVLGVAENGGINARYYVTTFADEAWDGGVSEIALPAVLLVCEDRLIETAGGWRFASRNSQPAFARPSAR